MLNLILFVLKLVRDYSLIFFTKTFCVPALCLTSAFEKEMYTANVTVRADKKVLKDFDKE